MKKQTLKRIISLALAGAMSVSNLAAFSALAEEMGAEVTETAVAEEMPTDETAQPETEAAEELAAELAAQAETAEPQNEPLPEPLAEETEEVAEAPAELTEPELAAPEEVVLEEAAEEATEEPTDEVEAETFAGVGDTYQLMSDDIPYVISAGTDSNARDLCHYMFKWADDGDTTDAEGYVCHYSDALFNGRSAAAGLGDGKATTYNPVLANTTMCLTMTAFNSVEIVDSKGNPDLTRQSQNARDLLAKLGFNNPKQNEEFNHTPTTTSIGVVAAYKMIEDNEGTGKVPLVAIAVRGSGYQAEWAGNVTVGKEGDHEGFELAADKALAFVKQYLAEQAAGDAQLAAADHVKVWVTGFSRAAATANLTAAKLDRAANGADNNLIGKSIRNSDDVFAYTFETPKGHLLTQKDTTNYTNIFNIINPNDLVPMVAPVSYDFGRYGVDMYLPSKENNANYSKTYLPLIENRLNTRYAKKWVNLIDGFYYIKSIDDLPNYVFGNTSEAYPTQGLFFTDFISNLAEDGIGDRNALVDSGLQVGLQKLMEEFMGGMVSNAQIKKFVSTFNLKDLIPGAGILWNVYHGQKKTLIQRTKTLLYEHSVKCGMQATLTEEKCGEIAGGIGNLIVALRKQLLANPALMVSMIGNEARAAVFSGGDHVLAGHSVGLCKAWLEQMDPKETSHNIDYAQAFTAGEYRRVDISRSNSVKVKDLTTGIEYDFSEDGILNCEEVVESDVAMMTAMNAEQRTLYLPTNRGYEVTISFNWLNGDNDRVYVKVAEYSPAVAKQTGSGQVKRLTTLSGHPRLGGSTFTLTVPAFSDVQVREGAPEGSDVNYTMTNSKGEKISVTDYKLRDLNKRYVDVNIISNQPDLGVSCEYGTGLHVKGDLVYVYAAPLNGATFVGWKDEQGNTISTDLEYIYTVPETAGETLNLYADFTFCNPPKDVVVSNSSDDLEHPALLVTWEHSFETEESADLTDGFVVYRDGVRIADVPGNHNVFYLDKDVEPGKTYTYTVCARSIAFNDPDTDVIGIRTYESAPSEPVSHRAYLWLVPPTGVTAEDKRDGDKLFIEINWNSLTPEELARGEVEGYYVYRDGVLLNRTGLTTSYTDYGVQNGKSYTYTVQARSSAKDERGDAQVSPMSEPAQTGVDYATAPDVSVNGAANKNSGNSAQQNRASYKIIANISDGGTISNLGTTEVAAGENVTYTITPLTGYKVSYVMVDGKNIGAVESYTFNSVSGDHEILAVFTQDGRVHSKIPQTSDEQPLGICVVLALGSVFAMGWLTAKKRREH